MRITFQNITLYFSISILLLSCANIATPTGGPKDSTAPVIRKRSLKDSAFYFKGGKISFEFDEFVQLKDIQNQLVITPLLATKPKLTVHKKRVTLHLPDSLLMPNTTYKVSMGSAIQDLHESNPVPNLMFTFSTGSYFDSLLIQGNIFEARSGKPDTASWVLLYPLPHKDSAFAKQKPMYAQKSNQGFFRIENLPSREFVIYSLKESNNNFRYDAADEAVSFYKQNVNPNDTSLFITLYSFIESEKPDTGGRKSKLSGRSPVIPKMQSFTYLVNVDTTQKTKRTFDLNDSLIIVCNDSISKMDVSKIRLFQDEQFDATASVKIDTSMKRIIIKTDWVQDAVYTLKLMKSFAESINKLQAAEGVFTFKTKKESDYGFLTVSGEADKNKIIELVKDDKVIAQKNAIDTLTKFVLLNPGNYQVRILDDKNGNGIWDTGNLFQKKMPEIVTLLPEAITIKANWGNKINMLHTAKSKSKLKGLK